MDQMYRFKYTGPVTQFGKVLIFNWKAETMAPSEKKAKSNFMYQFKQSNNQIQKTKIELPGKIERSY